MHPDFKELFAELNAEKVKYLVVGGHAVSLHAQPRATKDLDILVKPETANADALFRALAKFGAALEGLKPADLIEPGSFFRLGKPPVMIDILPQIAGVDFDGAWRRRVVRSIDRKTGLKVPFISAPDLLSAKQAAGRPQDLADIAAIREAQGARSRTPKKRPDPLAKKPGKDLT